jgi:hypothetical protein
MYTDSGNIACCTSAVPVAAQQPPTLRESLASKRTNLAAQLARVDEALAALDANPGVENVLNLVQKANW